MKPDSVSVIKKQREKRRSFKAVHDELLAFVKAKERSNPVTIQNLDKDINQLDRLLSKCKDLVWHALRYVCSKEENQVISGWKGSTKLQMNQITATMSDTCQRLLNHQQRWIPCKKSYVCARSLKV